MLSPKIETQRLILRRYEEKDLDAFYEIIHDDRLQLYIPFPNYTLEQELDYIKDCMKSAETDTYERWAIVLKDSNQTIGNISVNVINTKHNYCDVGYVIRHDYWGNGYAAEALEVVSDHLLDEGYYLVECTCNELNKQSSRVMEKAGFQKDGSIPNRRLNKDGTYSSVAFYSKCRK
ncbi:MAG: GNAT family N-acetyltransferase [Bacilli bacterium]|nr:GNAT family N-acetyltransferase [Bacilli bacterium]